MNSPCPRCGSHHTRDGLPGGRPTCGKHRTDGTACRSWCVPGLDCCRSHGGGSATAQAAGRRRVTEVRAQALLQRTLHDPDSVPVESYADEVRRVAGALRGAVDVAGAAANDLDGRWTATDAKGTVHLRPEVDLWRRLSEQYGGLLLSAARLGLDERVVRVKEAQAAIFAQGLTWLQGEARIRLDLNEAESRVFGELLGEMLARLDAIDPAP